jgi:hypothetical protein
VNADVRECANAVKHLANLRKINAHCRDCVCCMWECVRAWAGVE